MIQSSLGSSYLSFLDRYGNDLNLPLTNFGITTSMNSYVTGYSLTGNISHAVLFLFSDGTNKVYMYVPFSTNADAKSADAVDLTSTSAPTNSLSSYSSGSSLSAFNFFDNTDYNQWYTSVVGTSTILISKFIYKVSTALNASDSGNLATTITGLKFEDTVGSTGNKLCYASLTTGNVNLSTHSSKHI